MKRISKIDIRNRKLTTIKVDRNALILMYLPFNHQEYMSMKTIPPLTPLLYIYIFIVVTLDESIFLDVLHFPMKNIKSRDLEATPMGGATSKPIQ